MNKKEPIMEKYFFSELLRNKTEPHPEGVNSAVIEIIKRNKYIPKDAIDIILDAQKNKFFSGPNDQMIRIIDEANIGISLKLEIHFGIVKQFKMVKIYKEGSQILYTFKNKLVVFDGKKIKNNLKKGN